MELSLCPLRQKSDNKFCTPSSRPTAFPWTDAGKDTPTTPAPPVDVEYDSAQMDYNLPMPSRKALPDNYERGDDNVMKQKRKSCQGHSIHAHSYHA